MPSTYWPQYSNSMTKPWTPILQEPVLLTWSLTGNSSWLKTNLIVWENLPIYFDIAVTSKKVWILFQFFSGLLRIYELYLKRRQHIGLSIPIQWQDHGPQFSRSLFYWLGAWPKVSIQGGKSLWGNCGIFPRLGTRDTDRWLISKAFFWDWAPGTVTGGA